MVKHFANTRDPTMCAAASDSAVGRVVEFKAVLQNYSMFTIDVKSAHKHAWGTNLSFWNRHRKRLRNMVIVCVEVDQCDLRTSQGCKIVARAL